MFAEDKSLSIRKLCEKTGLPATTAKREIAFLKKGAAHSTMLRLYVGQPDG